MKSAEWAKQCDQMESLLKEFSDRRFRLAEDISDERQRTRRFRPVDGGGAMGGENEEASSWDQIEASIKEYRDQLDEFRGRIMKVQKQTPDPSQEADYFSFLKKMALGLDRANLLSKHAEELLQKVEMQRMALGRRMAKGGEEVASADQLPLKEEYPGLSADRFPRSSVGKDRFPIVPGSPESAYLEDLAGYLGALEKAGRSAPFDLLMALVKDSPLTFEDKKKIRMRYLQALRNQPFALSDLAFGEAELLGMLGVGGGDKSLRAERVRHLAAYVGGFAKAYGKEGDAVSQEVGTSQAKEALLRASPFRHWRVRHFFEYKASFGKLGSMDSEMILREFNAYWLKCEEEGMNAREKGDVKSPIADSPKEGALSQLGSESEKDEAPQAGASPEMPVPKVEGGIRAGEGEARAQELLERGQKAVAAGQFGEALCLFKGAWKVDLANVYMKSRVREFYDLLLLAEGGVGLLSAEAERDPYDSLIQTVLSKHYFKIGDNKNGVRHAEKAFALNPNVKPEIMVEALTKGLSDREKGRKNDLSHLFEGIPELDEVSTPIDASKGSSIPERIMGKVRDLTGNLMARFTGAPEMGEEPISAEDAEAASQSIPDNPKGGARFTAIEDKDLEGWFAQGEVKPVQTLVEAGGADFEKGGIALANGKTDDARQLFLKVLKENPENADFRHGILNAFRAHGFPEMGEAIVSDGFVQDSGMDLLAMGNFFCENGTLRDFVLAWNYFSRAMRIDPSLFQRQDLDALEGQIKVRAKKGGVALVLMMSKEGNSYALPPLEESSPKAKPGVDKEAILSMLEEQGLVVDREGQTLEDIVNWLAKNDDVDSVRMAINAGLDPNGVDSRGSTPLMMAASTGSPELVKELLGFGADPNLSGSDGWTPLMLAINNNNVRVVNVLIVGGAKVDQCNGVGDTPLLTAAGEGKTDIVELLLNHGARVDLANVDGNTALMKAANFGHLDIFKLLQAKGASVSAKNKQGMTAWDFEQKRERENAELAKKRQRALASESQVGGDVAPKITPQMPGYPRRETVNIGGDPLYPFSAPIEPSIANGEWDVASTLTPAEVAPDKQALDRLYRLLATGDDLTIVKRNRLFVAAEEYKELIEHFPKMDHQYRKFIPILRKLWLKAIISKEVMFLVHNRDLALNPEDVGAYAEMGRTVMTEDSYKSQAAAVKCFKKALALLALDKSPKGEYEDIPALYEQIVERLANSEKAGQQRASDALPEARPTPAMFTTENGQPRALGVYRAVPGVIGLMSVESVSDKDDDKGKR